MNKKKGEVISFGLDFVPVVGTAKGVIEGFSGRDTVTGEKLNILKELCAL